MNRLQGSYRVEPTGGLLPAFLELRKQIAGADGTTHVLDSWQLPFHVLRRGPDVTLRYEGPLRVMEDRLVPLGDGRWQGRAFLGGVEYAQFRLVPEAPRRRRRLGLLGLPLATPLLAMVGRRLRRRMAGPRP